MNNQELNHIPKVLMLTSYDFNGRYFRDFAKVLSRHQQKLVIMSTSRLEASKQSTNSEIFSLTISDSSSWLFSSVRQILRIRKFNPDIIQTHLFRAGILGIIYGKILKKKVILTRHHIDEHVQVGNYFHRFIDRASAKLSDHVVVFSEAAKTWLRDVESIDGNRISVINQGFDFSKLDPNCEEIEQSSLNLDFSPSGFNIICIARYSKTKGQVYLVDAVGELVTKFENIRLTFIGPGDSDWLIDYVESKGLKEYIRCLPSRADIAASIAASDLVVHPSLVDSFSQLIIEVQGVGTALIATDIAAAREQIEDGLTGIIVPPRDSSSIANAIELLFLNTELRKRMGIAAREHVRRRFTLDRMYQEQMACYQKVLKPQLEGNGDEIG